jgi:hypothetical protein
MGNNIRVDTLPLKIIKEPPFRHRCFIKGGITEKFPSFFFANQNKITIFVETIKK